MGKGYDLLAQGEAGFPKGWGGRTRGKLKELGELRAHVEAGRPWQRIRGGHTGWRGGTGAEPGEQLADAVAAEVHALDGGGAMEDDFGDSSVHIG